MVSTSVVHATWGPWPSVRLATDAVEIEVVSELGARVVSLRHRRRERQWLQQGEPPTEAEARRWSAEDVTFGGRESFGWDECLPTTSVCPDPLDPQGRPLRDHGDHWGRPTYLSVDEANGVLEHTWGPGRWLYRFSRRLSFVDEQTLQSEYMLSGVGDTALPIHWAQHPVLDLPSGSTLVLPGIERAARTWHHGVDLPEVVDWPMSVTLAGEELDLATIQRGQGWAADLYAQPRSTVAAVAPDGARLEIDWDRSFAPHLRIWIDVGGWPPGADAIDQVALEPVTSAADHLQETLRRGEQRSVSPKGTLHWWVRMRLS